ncbi:MAG: ACP S-malonyltransferase [Ruminococcaceae bacterium]|nr:ACP S-malonyltransferase [Oscillospiraceae bacterium]
MGKIAFLFPGQGAQYPGMGLDFFENYKCVRDLFAVAETISPGITETCFYSSEDELMDTENAQPCIFLVEASILSVVSEFGICADAVAGFSLGELTAVYHSGMFTFHRAFSAVLERARLMKECTENIKGEMYAIIGLESDIVEDVVSKFEHTYAANFNTPKQTVVSTSLASADNLKNAVASLGGRSVKLQVSGAFHTPFMNKASELFYRFLSEEELSLPKIPVYSNFTARPYTSNFAETLSKQINNPVRWWDTVINMCSGGVDTMIEIGPGKVLSSMISRNRKEVNVYNISDISGLEKTLKDLGDLNAV